MPENNPTIREYDSDVITSLPKDQKLKIKETEYIGVHILEAIEPIGTQQLKTEDIVDELKKIPSYIRKFIISIVLNPFPHPDPDFFEATIGRKINPLASAYSPKGQIIIYAIPDEERGVLKDMLAKQSTLLHEAGHIIDGTVLRGQERAAQYLAYTPRWTKAMCEDSKYQQEMYGRSHYFVSPYSEELNSLREDFADSVMYFSDGINDETLKANCPNRCKILGELLNDH
jgi:hypothetical protein